MRISGIRLLGFKSFAQKTEFVLDPGITAIVGPNGCGKSNVIDAVKWVLGEQRPSSLRAKEMLDVVFAGSDKRKPLGMAEVGLVFDNSDGLLSVEMTEVVLSRRLYRSGESEYLLNGEVCRLKDLREILMDTGSGLDALSIMEQGRIDAILTANPVERRTVFEEAAGIGKYKARRRETLRRLERVGDDLVRLRDVIEMTEKQLRSLRYQASRARRFRELTGDLKKKRVTWALYRYHSLLTERHALSDRLAAVSETEAQANRELRVLIDAVTADETVLTELSTRRRGGEAELYALEGEIRSGRQRGQHERSMAAEFSDRAKWCESEVEATERRALEATADMERLSDEFAALTAEAAVREAELTAAEGLISKARAEESVLRTALEELNGRRVALMEQGTVLRNERAEVQGTLRSREAIRDRMQNRQETVRGERGRAEEELLAANEVFTGRKTVEDELRERLRTAEEEEVVLEERLADLGRQDSESGRRLSGWQSRLELLVAMKKRHEGMDESVRRLLSEARQEGSALRGLRGVVADLIRVAAEDAGSVELALGACAQAIVTETFEDAVRAIGWLKEKKLGRALFMPLDRARQAEPTYSGNGVTRLASGVVGTEEEYRVLLEALLSDSVLVEDLDTAKKVSSDCGGRYRIVTSGGEVMNRVGGISGGKGRAAPGLLGRGAEIEKLGVEIANEEERRAALSEALTSVRTAYGDLRSEIRALREEWDLAGRAVKEAEGHLGRLERDLKRLRDEDRVLAVELSEVEEARESLTARDEVLLRRSEKLVLEEGQFSDSVAEEESRLTAAREATAERVEQRTEIRIVLAGARERVSGAESRLADLERGLADARRNIDLLGGEKETCVRRALEAETAAEEAETLAASGEERRKQLEREVGELREKHEEARRSLTARREDVEKLRSQHDSYRDSLEEFRVKESEARTRLEGLMERVREEFELDIEDLYEGFDPTDVNWEVLDEEVTELKQKIDRMGNVNLEAIDQLEEVDERAKFLRGEEEDLLKSREELKNILRKVNRESRERFERSFAEIRGHFREMFRKLFGGGNADILLQEGEDILEAGIEIVVRPPGRELQNLNLLSGGEKTLTAVALLFAIFKARPSPFALMDEVDAALDESNIDRFLSVLRSFTDTSQFIIITHNKRTMAEADALYGVSMPEPGVSQQVSIRFSENGGKVKAEEKAGEIAGAGS